MMKFIQKNASSKNSSNTLTLNNSKDAQQFDNRADADPALSPSSSGISFSNQSSQTTHPKTPSHFHHPDYVKESTANENYNSTSVSSSQRNVNVHPESGVDYSSILHHNHRSWQSSPSPSRSSYRRSWYSRWEDKIDEEVTEKYTMEKEEKRRRNTEEILKLPCSLGKMVIVEQEKLEADMERQNLDPRWTSRSPNASNPVLSKPRFKSPVNASPSRTLREVRDKGQSTPNLPTRKDDKVNNNHSVTESNGELNCDNGTFILVNDEKRIPKGASMPEISGHVKIFPYHILSTQNSRLPKGVDRTRLEQHLTYKEFNAIFGMPRDEFWKLPKWKRMEMKKKVNLF